MTAAEALRLRLKAEAADRRRVRGEWEGSCKLTVNQPLPLLSTISTMQLQLSLFFTRAILKLGHSTICSDAQAQLRGRYSGLELGRRARR